MAKPDRIAREASRHGRIRVVSRDGGGRGCPGTDPGLAWRYAVRSGEVGPVVRHPRCARAIAAPARVPSFRPGAAVAAIPCPARVARVVPGRSRARTGVCSCARSAACGRHSRPGPRVRHKAPGAVRMLARFAREQFRLAVPGVHGDSPSVVVAARDTSQPRQSRRWHRLSSARPSAPLSTHPRA